MTTTDTAEGTGMLDSLWLWLAMLAVRLISKAQPPGMAFVAIIKDRATGEVTLGTRDNDDEVARILDSLLDDERSLG